jgi:predicted nucleic acid-binding protein
MILVDTSIWLGHLGHTDERLQALLEDGQVLGHPFVLGEIALGHLRQRAAILRDYRALPEAIVAGDHEVLGMIDRLSLASCGIGYVDAHLLAATRLTAGASLWSHDRHLAAAASRLNLAARVSH